MSDNKTLEFLLAAQEDFDEFIAKKDWNNALAIIGNLYDLDFEHQAAILRKTYLIEHMKAHPEKKESRTLFIPRSCTYSTPDCSFEDECGCNQFSRGFEVTLTKTSLFDMPKTILEITSKEPMEMVWHRGKLLITSLPSKKMAF